jgi:hypothetical protein
MTILLVVPGRGLMTRNVGTVDRIARAALGLLLIAYALGLVAPDTGYNAWGWIGVVPLATAAIRFCPAYRILGVRTCRAAD